MTLDDDIIYFMWAFHGTREEVIVVLVFSCLTEKRMHEQGLKILFVSETFFGSSINIRINAFRIPMIP